MRRNCTHADLARQCQGALCAGRQMNAQPYRHGDVAILPYTTLPLAKVTKTLLSKQRRRPRSLSRVQAPARWQLGTRGPPPPPTLPPVHEHATRELRPGGKNGGHATLRPRAIISLIHCFKRRRGSEGVWRERRRSSTRRQGKRRGQGRKAIWYHQPDSGGKRAREAKRGDCDERVKAAAGDATPGRPATPGSSAPFPFRRRPTSGPCARGAPRPRPSPSWPRRRRPCRRWRPPRRRSSWPRTPPPAPPCAASS